MLLLKLQEVVSIGVSVAVAVGEIVDSVRTVSDGEYRLIDSEVAIEIAAQAATVIDEQVVNIVIVSGIDCAGSECSSH